jgi:hypothetical protein
LSDEHKDCKDDSVSNEGAAHDEMGEALSKVVFSAVTQSSNSSKEHLYPSHYGHSLPNDSVAMDCNLSNLSVESLCDVELQVDAEGDLYDEHDHEDVGEGGVDVLRECPSLM